MIPVSLPAPINSQPRHFTFLALAICVLAAAYIVERVSYWSRYWQTNTAGALASEPVSLTIGTAQFRLPVGYIDTMRQRHQSLGGDSEFEALRLSMHWPDLGSAASRTPQRGAADEILVELEHNPGRESLRARLDPFYRRLARGAELSGPDGLKILTLSARRTPKTDLIVYDPSVRNGFIARCLRKSTTESATCHRAILLASGLELRYRFDQGLLPDWRKLDSAIIAKVESFRVHATAMARGPEQN
ncbi:hypothetical protein [Roseibium salinum]|uniref:Uncharacterized protein n=1 Tax=Roseibium salinum TaxID=1604349 RepID=A0ABT3QZA8_9HYPH|nr:hypothetical protein [Roseibium sp. DSM 29163]MCX2722293.1 hypothetical protein [Roseibium sp. DSM 29163]MDN3719697.1 hypothetical protein [Roseibium salinum]